MFCGEIVPEGYVVCPNCEYKMKNGKFRVSDEFSKGSK